MRGRGHRIAALVTAAALALPGAAWAQSAGDDQYEDPFAPQPGQTDDGGSQGAEPEPAPAPEPAAPEPAPATTAQAPNGGEPELPRTGADEGLVALAGVMLLAGGIALRVRTRSEPSSGNERS
jgi:LPXTG-motif cell wall-anchored protein